MEILLGLSLIPLLIKSLNYVLIGSFAPMFVFILFSSLLIFAFAYNTKYRSLIVKIWSVVILLWGIARITLMILFLSTSVQEAHVESQFGIWYILASTAYIVTGIYFFRATANKGQFTGFTVKQI